MPTRNTNTARWGPKPWRARARYLGDDYHLGMYDTEDEAIAAERRFIERKRAKGRPIGDSLVRTGWRKAAG